MSRGVVVVTAAGSGRAAMSASRATHPGNPMPPCQGQISQWLAPDLLHIPARVVHSEHWSRDLAAHVPSLRWHTTDAWLSSARALAASACTAVGEPRAWQHDAHQEEGPVVHRDGFGDLDHHHVHDFVPVDDVATVDVVRVAVVVGGEAGVLVVKQERVVPAVVVRPLAAMRGRQYLQPRRWQPRRSTARRSTAHPSTCHPTTAIRRPLPHTRTHQLPLPDVVQKRPGALDGASRGRGCQNLDDAVAKVVLGHAERAPHVDVAGPRLAGEPWLLEVLDHWQRWGRRRLQPWRCGHLRQRFGLHEEPQATQV